MNILRAYFIMVICGLVSISLYMGYAFTYEEWMLLGSWTFMIAGLIVIMISIWKVIKGGTKYGTGRWDRKY